MKIRVWISGTVLAIAMLATVEAPAQDCRDYRQYMHWIGSTSERLEDPDGLGIAAGHLCVATRYDGLKIYDITGPSGPRLTGSLSFPYYLTDVECRGHLAYVALALGGVQIVDVADPIRPVITGALPAYGYRLQIEGDRLFVYDNSGISMFDISAPEAPLVSGRIQITYPRMIAICGNFAYVTANGAGLVVYDISDPRAPVERRRLFLSEVGAVVLLDRHLQVESLNALNTYSLTEPANPRLLGSQPGHHGGRADTEVLDDRLAISSRGRVKFFDISDPSLPVPLGSLATDGTIADIEIKDGRLFAASAGGLQCFDIAPRFAATEDGAVPTSGSARAVCAAGNIVYMADGPGHLQCVDIAEPSSPRVVGTCDLPNGPYSMTWCVEIHGRHVFIGDYRRLEIVDIGDPLRPVPVGGLSLPGVMDIAIRDTIAVAAVGGPGSLKILDIRDAASPALRGTLDMPLVCSVAFCGGFAYAAVHTEGLHVVDLTDPAAPRVVGTVALDDNFGRLFIAGDRAYLGSNSGLRIFDTSDPGRPRLIETLPTPARALRLRESEGRLYAACGFAGLQIFEFGDRDQLLPAGTVQVTDVARDLAIAGRFVCLAAGDAGLRIVAAACPPPPLTVVIDVRPGDVRNVVPCGGRNRGLVPVAVLTSPEFDARRVDDATVRLSGVRGDGARGGRELSRPEARGKSGPRREVDVDGDGDIDLLLGFRVADADIECGDTGIALTGRTFEGREIAGFDGITTVGGGHPARKSVEGLTVAAAPNPFNPRTAIALEIPEAGHARVRIYDLAGRLVRELTDGILPAGRHEFAWDGRDVGGRDVAAGVYLARIEHGGDVRSLSIGLVR